VELRNDFRFQVGRLQKTEKAQIASYEPRAMTMRHSNFFSSLRSLYLHHSLIPHSSTFGDGQQQSAGILHERQKLLKRKQGSMATSF
jgi:hypothetical protein